MLKPSEDLTDADPSLRELLTRLADDGKAYAKAEADLFKVKAEAKVMRYRTAALLAGGAIVFALVSLVILFVAIGAGLSTLLGPLGGYAASSLLALAISIGLALAAKARSKPHG